MNMRILLLSSLLVITSFASETVKTFNSTLTEQEKTVYTKELHKARKDRNYASLATSKICTELDDTEEGKMLHQKIWEEEYYHHSKVAFLKCILAKNNPIDIEPMDIEDVIKILENPIYSDLSDPIDYTKSNRQAAQYFRSLADQINTARFEGTMPEYQ